MPSKLSHKSAIGVKCNLRDAFLGIKAYEGRLHYNNTLVFSKHGTYLKINTFSKKAKNCG